MCVIPWITEGNKRNVVTTRDDFEASGGRKGETVCILNSDSGQFSNQENTNVSYDLRVGSQYRHYGARGAQRLQDEKGKSIKLRPGRGAIIQTEEEVFFPETVCGLILPKELLLQQGISNTPTKVDPGYPGRLHIAVFNHGRQTVELERKTPFCALFLLRVGEGIRPYKKASKVFAGEVRRGVRDKIYDAFLSHLTWRIVAATGVVLGLILAFLRVLLVDILNLF